MVDVRRFLPNSRHQGADELDGHSGLACILSVIEYGRGTPDILDVARHLCLESSNKYRVVVAGAVARPKAPGQLAVGEDHAREEASEDSQVDQEHVEECASSGRLASGPEIYAALGLSKVVYEEEYDEAVHRCKYPL